MVLCYLSLGDSTLYGETAAGAGRKIHEMDSTIKMMTIILGDSPLSRCEKLNRYQDDYTVFLRHRLPSFRFTIFITRISGQIK